MKVPRGEYITPDTFRHPNIPIARSVDVAQNEKPLDAAEPPILSNTPPSGASPPRRRLTMRIQRDIDADPSTSDMSPLVEAEARHHLERDHSPGPPRKHVKRISRSNEDIFGTPEPSMSSTSASATVENSPTHFRDA